MINEGVKSELIRSDTVETQKGVPFYADFQIINVNTCEPLEGVYLDAWHGQSNPLRGFVQKF